MHAIIVKFVNQMALIVDFMFSVVTCLCEVSESIHFCDRVCVTCYAVKYCVIFYGKNLSRSNVCDILLCVIYKAVSTLLFLF